MRSRIIRRLRSLLFALLAAGLFTIPAMAANSPVVGTIVTSENATLSNIAAARGADVYPGDTLATEENGSLRIASGANQLYLLDSTDVTMSREGDAIRASLGGGTIDFSGLPGQVEIQTPLGVIRGDGTRRVVAQVAMISATQVQISVYEGALLVSAADGTSKTIAAGEAYAASIDSRGPTDPGIQGVGRPRGIKINWRRVAAVAIVGGGLAAVTYELYNVFTESCSKVNCGH
ncbi:MAG: hypothetical protein KGL75_10765 [Acidobacteriota bacterium]|nr:hypothetical protein [Acidobacteriota bacterium]